LARDPSHLIIEFSLDTDTSNYWNVTLDGEDIYDISQLDLYSSANPSNPLMPGEMWGLKLNTPNDFEGSFSYQFYSDRAPVWGDFYVKDGKESQVDVVAWNVDFLEADPLAPPQDGLLPDGAGGFHYKILRPNGPSYGEVPEPTTLMLFGMGVMGLGLWRRRR
jgi:hypothetical protein